MEKNKEESVQAVLEEITFILNELRNKKLNLLEKTKLNMQQEEMVQEVRRDLEVCVTKLGLILHTTEL